MPTRAFPIIIVVGLAILLAATSLFTVSEAELAIQQKPEVMSVAGTELVGPLPAELNLVTVYVAGIGTGSAQAEAGKAFIASLRSADVAATYKVKGLDPG